MTKHEAGGVVVVGGRVYTKLDERTITLAMMRLLDDQAVKVVYFGAVAEWGVEPFALRALWNLRTRTKREGENPRPVISVLGYEGFVFDSEFRRSVDRIEEVELPEEEALVADHRALKQAIVGGLVDRATLRVIVFGNGKNGRHVEVAVEAQDRKVPTEVIPLVAGLGLPMGVVNPRRPG